MNEVHWSDPEFQEWEREQLGEYKEDTYQSVTGELMKLFRHEYPDGYYHRPGISMNYARAMFTIKDEFTRCDAADSAETDPSVDGIEEWVHR